MEKKCGLCDKEVNELHSIAQDYLLGLIESEHPDWVESDGACTKCIEYYYSLDNVKTN